MKGDKDRLEQVLYNLLSNANKFSPTGSTVILRAGVVDGKVEVEVIDSAPAITEEEKTKIFSPYYRGDDAKERMLPGIGLGLTICKKLVELHNGDMWVHSNAGGKGNIFAFSLPTLPQVTDKGDKPSLPPTGGEV